MHFYQTETKPTLKDLQKFSFDCCVQLRYIRVYIFFSLVTQRQKADLKNKEKILKEEKRKERQQLESIRQQRRAEVRLFVRLFK